MDDFFEESEKLYRAVIPEGMYIKENGELTSAAFKSETGCSVDRGRNRSDEEASSFMKQNLNGSVYVFAVRNCRERTIHIEYEPTETNPFHSGLYKNSTLEKMTRGQLKHLASVARLVSH